MQKLKEHGLRNIRIYPDIIKTFARSNKLDLAYQIFEDMQSQELNQKTRKQLNDQAMLVLLMQTATKQQLKNAETEMQDDKSPLRVATSIFNYLEERCIAVGAKLGNAILECQNLQPDWSAVVIEASMRDAISGLGTTATGQTDTELANFMMCIKSSLNGNLDVLMELEEFLDQQGPFDVVVDGANVMFASERGRKSEQIHLQPANLIDIIKKLDKKGSHVLVVLPELVERRSNFSQSKEYEKLSQSMKVQFLYTTEISDDIVLLYAALHSESSKSISDEDGSVILITNDSLRDHVPLLKQDQWKFLNWIRSRQVKFYWDANHEISLKQITAPIYKYKDSWFFPREDGKLIYVSKGNS